VRFLATTRFGAGANRFIYQLLQDEVGTKSVEVLATAKYAYFDLEVCAVEYRTVLNRAHLMKIERT